MNLGIHGSRLLTLQERRCPRPILGWRGGDLGAMRGESAVLSTNLSAFNKRPYAASKTHGGPLREQLGRSLASFWGTMLHSRPHADPANLVPAIGLSAFDGEPDRGRARPRIEQP